MNRKEAKRNRMKKRTCAEQSRINKAYDLLRNLTLWRLKKKNKQEETSND